MQNQSMELGQIIDVLYQSEINCEVSTFWDAGMMVRPSDEANGFVAQKNVRTPQEAAEFQARIRFPDSLYALGKFEFERRQSAKRGNGQ